MARPRGNNTAAQKRKGIPSQADYKYDFNPRLKQQTQAQTRQPIFKATNSIVIDLNPNPPSDIAIPDAPQLSQPKEDPSSS